jgi:hypothetical protein
MLDYNPLIQPFELPVQKLVAHCITEAPLFFPPSEGATPGTSLCGAFGQALWDGICSGNCQEPECQNPSSCVVPWLYKPYSKVHRRHFARPVLLRAKELESIEPVDVFSLEVTLWGRHAIAAQDVVVDALKKMGQLGFKLKGNKIGFGITQVKVEDSLNLAQRIEALPVVQSILLEFQTPFLHKASGERDFYIGQRLPLIDILGNVAYNLAAWDMEDRDLGEDFDARMRHNLARDVRDAAWAAAEELFVIRSHLSPAKVGSRFSGKNKHKFNLQGFVGLVELGGNLKSALPWLLNLALAGGGQKRSMGFGSVQMWLDV